MPEKTLNDPLSGDELKSIILQRIGTAMDRDCTLVDDLAYGGFFYQFELKIQYVRSLTKETLVWGNGKQGDAVDPSVPHEAVRDEYKTENPDQTRQEHDLPIPVMVQTPSGPQRRKVKIGTKETVEKIVGKRKKAAA